MSDVTTAPQSWIIIGLLAMIALIQLFFLFGSLYTVFSNKKEKGQFSSLWDHGKLDELIVSATLALKRNPEQADALYFGAKALGARGDLEKARDWYTRLMMSEPDLREPLSREVADLEASAGR